MQFQSGFLLGVLPFLHLVHSNPVPGGHEQTASAAPKFVGASGSGCKDGHGVTAVDTTDSKLSVEISKFAFHTKDFKTKPVGHPDAEEATSQQCKVHWTVPKKEGHLLVLKGFAGVAKVSTEKTAQFHHKAVISFNPGAPNSKEFNKPEAKEVRTNVEVTGGAPNLPSTMVPKGECGQDTKVEFDATMEFLAPGGNVSLQSLTLMMKWEACSHGAKKSA